MSNGLGTTKGRIRNDNQFAFDRGFEAAAREHLNTLDDNPYTDPQQYAAWRSGYKARNAASKVKK